MGVLALKRLIPAALRYRLSRIALDAVALPQVVRATFAKSPSAVSVRVSYGREHLPSLTDFAHGGIVKVQRMQQRWPNESRGFNVLYMVSSAMPPGARLWAGLARRRGARLVWNQNGVSYPATEPGWRVSNATMAPLLRSADHVFYQSAFCKLAADRFVGSPAGTWEVLHNSVDTRVFVPASVSLPPTPLRLMLGGNQSERYRLDAALATVGVLRRRGTDVRLIVTGNLRWRSNPADAMKDALESVAQEGVSSLVEFLGAYSQSEAPTIFHRAHILLHTKYNDPCPGVVIEALSAGLPVVYSASGGVPELVGDDAGYGVPVEQTFDRMIPPDPEALADGVQKVAADLPKYAAQARRRAVEQFDIEPWLARHAEVFGRSRT